MKYILENEETERLAFRILTDSDFDAWTELFHEPEAGRFLGMGHLSDPVEQCTEWFRRSYERYEKDLGGMNVLVDKNSGELVGQCGLLVQEVDGITELEIGYSVIPRFWGKGYATEAAQKCRDYAFAAEFTSSLISIIHLENIKSEKVAIKNGMSPSKKTNFKGMPVNIFRILREQWEQF